ncbi:MAG: hypothetical protein M3Y54_15515 [Bacteroidota bacterium]|nr:hypothetical protein [Bacteroidota bacterium]
MNPIRHIILRVLPIFLFASVSSLAQNITVPNDVSVSGEIIGSGLFEVYDNITVNGLFVK